MKKFVLFLLLALPVAAIGQGSFSGQQTLTDSQGHPMGGITITTYSDSLCTIPTNTWTNPTLTLPSVPGQATFLTDGLGNFSFWAPPPANSLIFYKASGGNVLQPSPCFVVGLPILFGATFPSINVTGNITGSASTILCLNGDTGLDRNGPASWNMGTCTPGDQSGSLLLATLFDSQIFSVAGTAASPPFAFQTDASTGIYHAALSTVGISAAGAAAATFSPTTTTIFGDEAMSSGKVRSWNGDTGISRDAAGVIDIGTSAQGNKTGTIKVQNAVIANINSVLWVDGIKYTTLAGCYADIPSTGGVCKIRPGYTETLGASITMNKNGAGFEFQGPATISMGSNQFIVSAGTFGAFITSLLDQGGQACTALPCTTNTNSVELTYTGNTAAILIGAATPQTQHAKIRGLYINLSGAGNAALGIDVIATAGHFDISQNFVLGSGGAPNTQIGLLLDGGGTTFTCDGEVDENFIINTLVGIKTANMSCENVYKGNQVACNPGSTPGTIGVDFEDNSFGNVIVGGNFSACSIIWKGGGTTNANYGIFPVNQETTDANFAAGTSMNVGIFLPQVGGGSNNPPVVVDAGINNTFSTGVTVPTRAYVREVAKGTATGTTTIFTTQGANTEYHINIAMACDSASAGATVSVTIKFTDPSNTVQTLTGLAPIACNALGGTSVASASFPFIAKASTVVQYSTVIANTPTYDLRIAITQYGTN